jgi:hypothetical protein
LLPSVLDLLDRVLVLVEGAIGIALRALRFGLAKAEIPVIASRRLRLVGRGLRQREEFQSAVLVASRAELLRDGKRLLAVVGRAGSSAVKSENAACGR